MRLRSPRWLVGTARLRARAALLDLRGRARRRPASSRVVPRPAYARRRATRLEIAHALVASDANPRYLSCWPLTREAWQRHVEVDARLVLVARPDDVPPALAAAPDVTVFDPVPGLHTALQAQCIRLLYPALVETDGAVVTSDVDMAPLDGGYFRRPAGRIRSDHFVAYRDVLLDLGEVPVCYNAARPSTWSSIFGVSDLDDVRARLLEWGSAAPYSGEHGGAGWTTDQRILYRALLERGRSHRDVWILDDHYTRFRRLHRVSVDKWNGVESWARELLAAGRYTDYDLLVPNEGRNRELNELVLELARRPAA